MLEKEKVGRDEGRLSLRLGLGRVVPRERSNHSQILRCFDAHSFRYVEVYLQDMARLFRSF